MSAKKLSLKGDAKIEGTVFGVFATCDPRIDKTSRERGARRVARRATLQVRTKGVLNLSAPVAQPG